MVRRRLSSEEEALWAALTRSVRPLRTVVQRPAPMPSPLPSAAPKTTPATSWLTTTPAPAASTRSAPAPAARLDSSWERRIRGGTLSPDISIDLHGHSLAAAHARLNQIIAAAIAQGARVLLVVTGKPRKSGTSTDRDGRGAIRAEIAHWLETSPYADRIASVRIAHPRHGGDGAIYLILRRKK